MEAVDCLLWFVVETKQRKYGIMLSETRDNVIMLHGRHN